MTAPINLWNDIKGGEHWISILTCQLDQTSVSYFTAKVHPFHVALHLNLDWYYFFFFLNLIHHRSKKKKKKTFWCSERNSLSLWQPRQLELIISANGKMRKRFFASPTSDSSSVWQLCHHRAAARMFMQTDYGNAGQRWMCVCACNSQFPLD